MSRRDVLKRAGGLALAASSWGVLTRVGGGIALAEAAVVPPFSLPLRFPPTITDANVTMRVAEADVAVLPGAPTRMWTFGGEFPGPIIRRPSGTTTKVTFEHALPAEAQTLTIHHHGHHSASSEDGLPDRNLIEPGASRTYTYEHVEESRPLRGGLRWYHDHSHGRTNRNAWKGLVGLFIIDDPVEEALGLPGGDQELPLVLCERQFDDANQLTDPFPAGTTPPSDDTTGSEVVGSGFERRTLVNGVPEPFHAVAPRRYRLRILNATAFHPYNLAFSDGRGFQIVGTESGLLPEPVDATSVQIGPAERIDVVVDLADAAGKAVRLVSVPRSTTLPGTAAVRRDIMEFRVSGDPTTDDSTVPAALRPLPDWATALHAAGPLQAPDRVFAFGLGIDLTGKTAWTINGRTYDPERVDATPELGSTETWLLVNTYTTSHYIHLHDVDWVVLGRNGSAPTAQETGLKETFRLDPGEALLVGAKFTDHLGPYMVHCHMLNHEDHAMMTTFEVVEPGQGVQTTVEPGEQRRVERILADQGRNPGTPGTIAGAPLPVPVAEVRRAWLCDLRQTS